jgi:putative membrane-bound dehydrogenase-like protein
MISRLLRRALAVASVAIPFLATGLVSADDADGFRPLFNGKDLSGWEGDSRLWSVVDGSIIGSTTPETKLAKNSFLIWRDGLVDDFVLRLRYRIANGNSGIQYRSSDHGDFVVGGYQADFEFGDTWSGILYEERGRGIVAKRGQKVRIGKDGAIAETGKTGDPREIQAAIRKGDWNDYEIEARGFTFIHKINGVTTVEVVDEEEAKRRREGILALQIHTGPPMTVEFKDILLRRLPLGDEKKIVLVAGRPSHGAGEHEHNAGVQLLAKCLDATKGHRAQVYLNGWPSDPTAFDNADTIVLYMDGGGAHPVNSHLDQVGAATERGAGLVCIHYAVEVEKGPSGDRFLDWIGGYFEMHWSINPHWDLTDGKLAKDHPITRGIPQPFTVHDEWYYHMRFRPDMKGVTSILEDVPPDTTRFDRGLGPHAGNEHVRERKGMSEIVAWAAERPGGSRGFGFTGGHFHRNWGHDGFRKLVLNAIVWTARGEIPETGIESVVTDEDLEANLDAKGERRARVRRPEGAKAFESKTLRAGESIAVAVDLRGAKKLFLVVDDGGDGFGCDWADWGEPRLAGADGKETRLTDVRWKKADAGWGEVRVDKNAGGGKFEIDGAKAAYGIGTHAPSVIEFDLPEGAVEFRSTVGLDTAGSRQGCGSTVRFSVYTDKVPETALRRLQSTGGGGGGGGGALTAEETLASFELAPGLAADIFASEPMIVNPTNLDVDARGRVWVLEGVNYRAWQNNEEKGERIVILEDSDGDGRADRAKTFYQGKDIDSALGICVLGTRVIVSRSPNVFIFTDEDGDDVPEKKDVLFSDIAGVQHDHGVHAFVFGPDGKLYFNMGDGGQRLRDAAGKPIVDRAGNVIETNGRPYRKGLVFRIDLDSMAIDTLGHNFRNNYEVAVDAFGSLWQSDNDDDGNRGVRINFVMEYGNYGYTDERTGAGWGTPRTGMEPDVPSRHWYQNDPGVVPNFLQTGAGSPTGICVYEGSLLPPVFRNEVIHCEPGQNVVRAYPALKSGAGYVGSTVDVVIARDRWFRPSDVCVDVDGGLLVADWYDAGVGGHNMADRDPKTMRGRIYRIAPTASTRTVPAFEVSTIEGASAALAAPNQARRYLAWQALHAAGEKAEPSLGRIFDGKDARMRSRALHLLARIEGKGRAWLAKGLADADEDIRVTSIRISRELGVDAVALVRRLAADPSPQVRRELAIALHGLRSSAAAEVWAELAAKHDGADRWYLEALGIGAAGNDDACLEAWLARVGETWNTPAGRDIVWRLRARRSAALLSTILLDPETPADARPRYLRAFDFLPEGEERTTALVALVTASDAFTQEEALRRLGGSQALERAELRVVVERIAAEARGSARYPKIVRQFGLAPSVDALLDVVSKFPADTAGAEAAKLLLDAGVPERLVAILRSDDADAAVRLALSLGNTADRRIVDILVPLVSDENLDPALRGQCVRSLARIRDGAARLVGLAGEEKVPDDLASVASVALAASPWDDVRAAAAKAFPAPPTRDDRPLPPVSELIERRGNALRGRKVYSTVCAPCHVAGRDGKDYGPALSEIGDKLGRDALYASILDPNAGVSFNYEGWTLRLRSGDEAVGIITSETDTTVSIKSAGAIVTEHSKKDILERRKLPASLMPVGLQQSMTIEELVDLVEYLSTLKKGAS